MIELHGVRGECRRSDQPWENLTGVVSVLEVTLDKNKCKDGIGTGLAAPFTVLNVDYKLVY